jgi:hypothetical protein
MARRDGDARARGCGYELRALGYRLQQEERAARTCAAGRRDLNGIALRD